LQWKARSFEGEVFENHNGDQRKPAGFYKNRLKSEDLQRKAGTAANIKQYKTKKPLQKK
jgi:hypothetical protein